MSTTEESRFAISGCTCKPWTGQGEKPRMLEPGENSKLIGGWRVEPDCPHHAATATCGKTIGVNGEVYHPCARPADHSEAYCRDRSRMHYFLASGLSDGQQKMRLLSVLRKKLVPIPDGLEPVRCGWAMTRHAHDPHSWEPQPGMNPVWCSGRPAWTEQAECQWIPGEAQPSCGFDPECPSHQAPETDEEREQREDREATERDHAAGNHKYCGVTCETEFPSDMLRNGVLYSAIPGSKTMLDELLRRAAAGIRLHLLQPNPTGETP